MLFQNVILKTMHHAIHVFCLCYQSSSFRNSNRNLQVEIQSQLQKLNGRRQETQSQLEKAQFQLLETQSQILESQSQLQQSDTGLQETQYQLEGTQSHLEETQYIYIYKPLVLTSKQGSITSILSSSVISSFEREKDMIHGWMDYRF